MIDEQSRKFLTPELRAHFETLGEDSVRSEVSIHNYGRTDKHRAALHWLFEKRQIRAKREKHMFWVAIATIVISAIGVVLAVLVGRQNAF